MSGVAGGCGVGPGCGFGGGFALLIVLFILLIIIGASFWADSAKTKKSTQNWVGFFELLIRSGTFFMNALILKLLNPFSSNERFLVKMPYFCKTLTNFSILLRTRARNR